MLFTSATKRWHRAWALTGVQVSCHTLLDFRVAHGAALDEVLSDNLAALMAAGVVKLKRVAQDGVRVRANAGAASFQREEKLSHYLEEGRREVETLKRAIDADPGGPSCKQQAARARAAAEREARIERALARRPELAEAKLRRQGKKAADERASSTDPEATVM